MANSALLVMDVQRDIVDIADDGSGYLPRLRRAIDGARATGIPVICVVIGLRPGHPEASTRNRVLASAVRAGLFTEGDPGTGIHHDVAPQQGDIVVTKRRASACSGSDLDLVLRARGVADVPARPAADRAGRLPRSSVPGTHRAGGWM